jgi:hypothetical protein
MGLPPVIIIVVLLAFSPGPAGADGHVPGNGMIIGVAQQFVAERLDLPSESHFSIAFDIAYIHPQPGGKYWAVVGGFTAETSPDHYEPHTYVAAVRLVCADHKDLECWRLDKLAINNQIVLDIGDPA